MDRYVKFTLSGLFAGLALLAAGALQPSAAQQVRPSQANPTGTDTGAQPGGYHWGLSPTPWFSNPAVRQQLNLNDQQYNQLNKAYAQGWQTYQQGLNKLGTNLTDEQRAQQMQQLRQNFYANSSTAPNNIITNPQQLQRYNQLHWQYRGYGAFNDPTIQKQLNLSAEQRQQLLQYDTEWNKQMGDLNRTYQADPALTMKRFNELRTQYNTKLNSVLNPQQQQNWQQMAGQPYNFPPSVYFQSNATINPKPPINPGAK